MLRDRGVIELYPSMMAIHDLITRTGDATSTSYTPFKGLAHVIDEQFTGSAKERWNLDDFLNHCKDRDIDPTRIRTKDRVDGHELIESTNAGFNTLDSMVNAQEYVTNYLIMLIIAYKKDSMSPYVQGKAIITYSHFDDDDEETAESELIKIDKDYDIEQHNKAVAELPFILKLLHKGSCIMHAHLFSFTRAYAGILKSKQVGSTIQPSDFSMYNTYRVKSNGIIDKMFVHYADNKGVDYPAAREWIIGYTPNDIYYKAAMRLLSICNILDIDILEENPEEYNASFINSILCTYIPTNDEYVSNFGSLDPDIQEALQTDNLFTKNSKFELLTEDKVHLNEDQILACIIINLESLKSLHPELFFNWASRKKEVVEYISRVVSLYTGNEVVLEEDQFGVVSGIITLNGQWLKIPANHIGSFDGNEDTECVITIFGACVLVESCFISMHYVTLDDANKKLEEYKGGGSYEKGWYAL